MAGPSILFLLSGLLSGLVRHRDSKGPLQTLCHMLAHGCWRSTEPNSRPEAPGLCLGPPQASWLCDGCNLWFHTSYSAHPPKIVGLLTCPSCRISSSEGEGGQDSSTPWYSQARRTTRKLPSSSVTACLQQHLNRGSDAGGHSNGSDTELQADESDEEDAAAILLLMPRRQRGAVGDSDAGTPDPAEEAPVGAQQLTLGVREDPPRPPKAQAFREAPERRVGVIDNGPAGCEAAGKSGKRTFGKFWSVEEDLLILQMVQQSGKRWSDIARCP